MDPTCECSDEYGPCEQHSETLVIRQGAAPRTSDELALLLVSDLMDCGVILTDEDRKEYERLDQALQRDPHTGIASFPDEDYGEGTLAELAFELADRVQTYAGYTVVRDDGYVIYRVHEDCPLLEA